MVSINEGNTLSANEVGATEKQIYIIEEQVPNGGLFYHVVKRGMDILVAVIAGVVCFPIMLVIAILIRLDSPGKFLFSQERLGKNGKSFYIYKFRTMHENSEENGPVWAQENDDRCTKVGAFLRKCRLDELPQLYNILVGQMSLVGPRPERAFFYDRFEEYIHGFKHRLSVTPGLTGLAQVNGGYDLKPEEKIIYDMEYIKTRNLWLDFKIILKTVLVVFKREGAK